MIKKLRNQLYAPKVGAEKEGKNTSGAGVTAVKPKPKCRPRKIDMFCFVFSKIFLHQS
jgi:hypothetical protein